MKRLIKSFGHASQGINLALREEPNFRIHAVISVLVILLATWLGLSASEWIALILVIAFVFAMEIVNSIFERVIDMLKPSMNEYVRDMKDMMAAGVVVAAAAAVIVGLIIFVPKLMNI